MKLALDLDGVTCTFPARAGSVADYTAISGVDLRVGEGEFVAVVGPTGCGKSTLLNVAAGLLKPTGGTVTVFGEPLARHQPPVRLSVPERCADALAQRARTT